MKSKLANLIISSLVLTVLTGCGSRNMPVQDFAPVQNTILAQDITTQSDEGLFEFITVTQRELFKAYDTNKNGFVTLDELSGMIRDDFAGMDIDHNGKLTFKEAQMSPDFLPRDFETKSWRWVMTVLFEKYADLDSNGTLTRDEFLNFWLRGVTDPKAIKYFKTAFTKNDLNKDGVLDFSEHEDTMYQMWRNHIRVVINDNGWSMILG
jgi:Ca2+-binding EF-hand superfamily protein